MLALMFIAWLVSASLGSRMHATLTVVAACTVCLRRSDPATDFDMSMSLDGSRDVVGDRRVRNGTAARAPRHRNVRGAARLDRDDQARLRLRMTLRPRRRGPSREGS